MRSIGLLMRIQMMRMMLNKEKKKYYENSQIDGAVSNMIFT